MQEGKFVNNAFLTIHSLMASANHTSEPSTSSNPTPPGQDRDGNPEMMLIIFGTMAFMLLCIGSIYWFVCRSNISIKMRGHFSNFENIEAGNVDGRNTTAMFSTSESSPSNPNASEQKGNYTLYSN